MLWILLIVAVTLAAVYWFIIRPLLKQQPTLSEAFKAEASLANKLRAKITGWRTRIAARLVMISGVAVGLYDSALPLIGGQDWTPLKEKIPAWALPVAMVGLGMLFAWLRKITDNAPQIITQKDDVTGEAKVVGLIQPVS